MLSQCESSDFVQSGAIFEIEAVIGRRPEIPDDISIGVLAAPRVARSPIRTVRSPLIMAGSPPISTDVTQTPGTPGAGDRRRVTPDGTVHLTPRLKGRIQPSREVKGNRPKQYDDYVIDLQTENTLRPKK